MRFSHNKRGIVKQLIAGCGLSPSFRIEILNGLLKLGKWLKNNECEVVVESRENLFQYINNEIAKNAPIDYLEFGVYRGQSIRYWIQLNRDQNSRFIGFDSFKGLPEDWNLFTGVHPKGYLDLGGKIPEINDQRVKFIKGYFQVALPGFLKRFNANNRLIINIDADLYSSTLYVLASLNHLMSPGSIIIFGTFSSVTHQFKAFTDFTKSFMRNYKLLVASDPFYSQLAIVIV